jgi:hypothetical protein
MEDKIKKFLKENKKIEVNNKLIKLLGFDDMRDFVKSIGDWGHCTDFTYRTETRDWQRFLRLYIKEVFLS